MAGQRLRQHLAVKTVTARYDCHIVSAPYAASLHEVFVPRQHHTVPRHGKAHSVGKLVPVVHHVHHKITGVGKAGHL